jgi:protein TonB
MNALALSLPPDSGRGLPRQIGGTALALALHLAAVAALLWAVPEPQPAEIPPSLAEMRISLISPASEPARPLPNRTQPRPQVRPAPTTAPLPAPLPTPIPAPAAVNAAAAPSPVLASAAPLAPPAPSRSEAPVRSQPPRFDADYLSNPAPAYPPVSRRNGEQGTVRLRVLVSAEGTALEVEVAHSSGYPRLDSAARQAVRQWRFVPARQGAQAISDWVVVPIDFKLDA